MEWLWNEEVPAGSLISFGEREYSSQGHSASHVRNQKGRRGGFAQAPGTPCVVMSLAGSFSGEATKGGEIWVRVWTGSPDSP